VEKSSIKTSSISLDCRRGLRMKAEPMCPSAPVTMIFTLLEYAEVGSWLKSSLISSNLAVEGKVVSSGWANSSGGCNVCACC